MNTDTLWTLESVERVKREFHKSRLSSRKNSLSWMFFVVIFCDQNEINYSWIMANEHMIERLNIFWLGCIKS